MIPVIPRKIHYIKNEWEVPGMLARLYQYDLLGFDTETYNSYDNKKFGFDPCGGARMRLSQWATPDGECFVVDHYHVGVRYLLKMFPNWFTIVGQNLKFDFKFLLYELGIDSYRNVWDTMLAGQLINKGNVAGEDFIPVGLADLVSRELDIELPKDEQASDWWRPELSTKQIEYAGRDALIVLPLYLKQVDKIRNTGQVQTAEIEFNCAGPIGQMELNGLYLEPTMWEQAFEQTTGKIRQLEDELWSEFAIQNSLFDGISGVNLNSSDQMIAAFEMKGLPVPINPKTGKKSLDGKNLAPLAKTNPLIAKFRDYRGLTKSLSSYGPSWIDEINPGTKRLHTSFRSIGAETGRMSASAPNIMQIKREDLYRNCFRAEEGWLIVSADYSQMELRILAEYCRDANLLNAFDNDYDLHRFSAHLIFQVLMDEVSGKQRGIAKNLNFGIVYGIGVKKFAQDAGISFEEAEKIMRYYLKEAYPQMGQWLDAQARKVLNNRYAVTMTGRIREYIIDENEDGAVAKMQRNAKNFPIQGTSADITKRAMYLVAEALKPYWGKIKMVNIIHDEILLESRVEYALTAQRILQEQMLKAEREFLKRVPSKVDGSINTCWVKEDNEDEQAKVKAIMQEVKQL